MKFKNTKKNNELIALVEVLKDKGVIAESEIKAKKIQILEAKEVKKLGKKA